MDTLQQIRIIEGLALNAWPAEEIVSLDGWKLRAAQGVTGRANSVWANGDGGQYSLAEKIEQVESFYETRNLPPRFQITPVNVPSTLDDVLSARNYENFSPTAVQIAETTHILQHTPPLRTRPEFEVELSEEFHEDWYALYCQSEQATPQTCAIRSGILQRIRPPVAFATLKIEGKVAAIALGVVEKEWMGVFNVETHPEFRRRGAATSIMRSLAIWAQMHSAVNIYLQVMAENQSAIAMYEKIGFSTLYHYHYRIKR